MKKTLLLAALAVTHTSLFAQSIDVKSLEIPHTRYELDNGLTLLVHEDHKAPIVAVSVWYNVGSKDEKPGKTGFAHLFEHLMFNGSENYDGEYFKPFEQVGATDMNGTTWFDRTNYFQNVPSTAVDLALWMESDRMGHLLGAITQEKLDNQRGVVQNEKRQGDNSPYRKAEYSLLEGIFPEGHPYRWSTIGSMEDLNAASLDDVKDWFKQYYGAANTVIVLAGDITAEAAKQKVEHYFGDIPPGPPVKRLRSYVPEKEISSYEEVFDKVAAERIYRVWPVAGRTTDDIEALNLLAKIAGEGKTSRLYQRLVEKEKLATGVSAYVEEHTLASIFNVEVTLADGADEEEVSAIIDEEITKLVKSKVTKSELDGARMRTLSRTIRGMEKIGGFGGKANVLAEGELYADDSNHYMESLERYAGATPKDLNEVAKAWLSGGFHQVIVRPFPNYAVSSESADRSTLPEVTEMPELAFPTPEEFKLDNGISVYFVKRDAVPDVSMRVVFNSGYAADANGYPLGTSSMTMRMLEEGSGKTDGEAYKTEMDRLGAASYFGASLDSSYAHLQSLTANLKPALSLFSEVIQKPAMRDNDLTKLKPIWLSNIAQEKSQPVQLAFRELPPLLFGNDHPYGMPLTGSGTNESVGNITTKTLKDFHSTWLRPDNAQIIVVGDIEKSTLKAMLNDSFGEWNVSGKAGKKEIADVPQVKGRTFYLADRPDSPQSLILAGKLIPSITDEDALAIDTANAIVGGKFTARLNMNLREDKGWAYGARTMSLTTAGMRPWFAYAPVQSDKTVDSINEIDREMKEYNGKNPATATELSETVTTEVRKLPGSFETNNSVLSEIQSSLMQGKPLNYPMLLQQEYDKLTLEDVREQSDLFTTDNIVYMIVGDASLYKAELEKMGKVVMLDIE
ncbi:M16 family metallopeptidase [Alteromonas confluentis]|uniref:Peptidase M16 n=1 Tax=Alteromonas confluentis TaxID=1656094 RepID=A0A1E7ZC56_9ALTE|nr:pitrilysin family protein [Alteromonas confluentis]OFC71088.1 hypothetical protein BFC18_09855 [Alteromonas confluentis]